MLVVSAAMAMGALAVPGPAAALDDDYLKLLEQESNDVVPEAREQTTRAPSGDVASGAENTVDRTGQGSASPFEQELRRDYPGSYHLYSRLSPDQQRQVQEKYERNGSFSGITRMILNLSEE